MKQIILFCIIVSMLLITGCSAPDFSCEEPNVVIDGSCCLDVDSDGHCDPEVVLQELPVEKEQQESHTEAVEEEDKEAEYQVSGPVMSEEEEFARTFESTWNKKNYNALYSMFSEDIQKKFSMQEFNFLMKRADAKAGILSVSFKSAATSSIEYIVTADEKIRVLAPLTRVDGKLSHGPFYIFEDIKAEDICDNEDCFVSYAKLSGSRNYCELAGDQRASCLEWFGTKTGLLSKIDSCAEIKDDYALADCLENLALKEKSIEPCWYNTYDKQTFECMGRVAAIDDNASLCREFVDSRSIPGTRLQHAHCIMGYVQRTLDEDACRLIDYRDDVVLGAMVENCERLKFI